MCMLEKKSLDFSEDTFSRNIDVKSNSGESSERKEKSYKKRLYHLREYIPHQEQNVDKYKYKYLY